MQEMFHLIEKHLCAGNSLVLVTVTAASGATPRGAGAHMLVDHSGRIFGTIGGGAVEYRAVELAKETLHHHTSNLHNFTLNRNDIENLGMICGGEVEVFFHFLSSADPHLISLMQEAEALFMNDEAFWLVSNVNDDGQLQIYRRSDCPDWLSPYLTGKPQRLNRDGLNLFVEQIHYPGRVFIFGGGHVAQELVPVLSHIGFRCVVLEDRPEFADPALFPDAEEVHLIDFYHISDAVSISADDYVCIMTRGHAHDTIIQAQLLKLRPCYLGVIGSRKKAAAVRNKLQEIYCFTDEELGLITTPIGLSIQAETPEEIAISIAAQLISVRASRKKL